MAAWPKLKHGWVMPPVDFNSDIHERLAAAEAALHAVGQQISPAIRHLDIAVLIPCFNEAATIGDVVKAFRVALPHARIFVYDNNSHDSSAVLARDAGAIVRREPLQGKGHAIRRMFTDVEADVYLLAEGNGTYDAASAPRMITRLIETQADMVVGARITEEKAAYRPRGRLGSRLAAGFVASIYGDRFTDMLSGYRAFSRRYVKSFPALNSTSVNEIDLTVHALELGMITTEIQAAFDAERVDRQPKLSTLRDVINAFAAIGRLVRDARPLTILGGLSIAAMLAAVTLQHPTLAVMSAIGFTCGAVLGAVSRGRRETKRLSYNQVESLAAKLERLEETRLTLTSLRAQVLSDNPAVLAPYGARKRRAH